MLEVIIRVSRYLVQYPLQAANAPWSIRYNPAVLAVLQASNYSQMATDNALVQWG
jgi:hypothetical protein